MELTRFPQGESVFKGRNFNESLFSEVDGILKTDQFTDGWLELETADARLICLFHKSKTYLAGLVEPNSFSWVSLADFPVLSRQLEDPVCNLVKADPIRILLMAVHFRNRPLLQATTDLVDLSHVLNVLAEEGQNAGLAFERSGRRTMLFLQKGSPARVFFTDESDDPKEGSVAERFLLHVFDPNAPVGKVEVFKKLNIEHDQDAGKNLNTLAAEAQPPPPINIVVRLAGRVVLQRPFMPPSVLIGREPFCGLILDNLSVSRQHAKIIWERGHFVVEDLDSANKTKINDQVVKRQELKSEDRIGVGKFELTLVEPPETSHPDATMLMMPKASMSTLNLVAEDRSIPLGEEVTIGKAQGVDIPVKGLFLKPVHARIKAEGHGIYRLICSDGASVQLNGEKVTNAFVHAGDELIVGRSRFKFESGDILSPE